MLLQAVVPHSNSIAWALLSQTVWLPLLAVNIFDQWQASVTDLTPPSVDSSLQQAELPAAASAVPGTLSATEQSRQVLATLSAPADPMVDAPISHSVDSTAPALPSLPMTTRRWTSQDPPLPLPAFDPPDTQPFEPVAAPMPGQGPAAQDPVLRRFSPAELLGGPLTLRDLDAPRMTPAAMAERARWAASGDPLAPLPDPWREPMRQALHKLPDGGANVEPARVVHLPSRNVTTTTTVPLALQSDGSVDVLIRPDKKEILEEIDYWSRQQKAPPKGTLAPAVLQLHPMEEVSATVTPQAAAAASPARSAATSAVPDDRPPQAAELDYWSSQPAAASPAP